jgi:3-deoxy-manno-octulosonate cytidylyltransferase (CMP-KDO synthetase)
MKILGVIPSRYSSTRLPGKPLIDIDGKTMIRRVYEQAQKATQLNHLVVATDDERIVNEVESFGGNVILTSTHHQSGTDRCAEVSEKITGYDVIINIQGDEPLIDPSQIDLLAKCFENEQTQIATLAKKIETYTELYNFGTPKLILNQASEALYFSRQAIPHLRDTKPDEWLSEHTFYKHIGIYGFLTETLSLISKLPTSSLEKMEMLEQLRWLENGYKIKVAITEIETLSVDSPEDVEKVLEVLRGGIDCKYTYFKSI